MSEPPQPHSCSITNKPDKSHSSDKQGISTRAIHSGQPSAHWTHNPVVAPLYMTSTYETQDIGEAEFEYSRGDNPTRKELQTHLAALESAKYGLAFCSGLGALTTAMFLLKSGDHVLCCDDLYGGTNRFFNHCATRMGIEVTFVDGTDVNNWVVAFIRGKTKLVWLETPTNPLMKILDVSKICKELKNICPNLIVIVDNTFMTPVFQSPLKMGADIVMHSATKYLNGHSDVIMGALVTNDQSLYDRLKYFQNALGIVPSAFDCSQVTRSIKTLSIRVKRQAESAMKLARFLERNKFVDRVLYPGLESHPQYSLACEQYTGFGGMISIFMKTVNGDEATKVVKLCKIFHLAVSLGCVCSLIELPALMTHSALTEENLNKLGITKNMIRISVGLEEPEDLINDISQAIERVYSSF